MTAYTIDISPVATLSNDQFDQLCAVNPEIKFERTPTGKLVIMSPTGGETGRANSKLNARFVIWNEDYELGEVFDSSTCFRMKEFGGGDRSPDVSWIEKTRWESLAPEQQRSFPPIAPDFVLELLSPSDSLYTTREKMEEYMNSGVQLGWLINPQNNTLEIYQPNRPVQILESPAMISAPEILPDFELKLDWLWNN